MKRTNQYYIDYRASLSQERKDIISERLKVKCANRTPEKIASDKVRDRIGNKKYMLAMSDKKYAAFCMKNNIRRQVGITRLQVLYSQHLFKIKDYDSLINFNSLFPTEQSVLNLDSYKSSQDLLRSLQAEAEASIKAFEENEILLEKKEQLQEKIQIVNNTEELFVGENDTVELSIGSI